TLGTDPVPRSGPEQKEKKKSNRKSALSKLSFSDWKQSQLARGEKLIEPDDPIWEFGEQAGIHEDLVALAWRWFVLRFENDSRLDDDWRETFRRCIREDWHKCWRWDPVREQIV